MNRDENLCWYHGKLSRENAEELIKNEGDMDGTFLIRESGTATGDFVLTLLFKGEVCHYQIRRHGEDAFFSIEDKIKILHGLETLVDFYQQAANGLVTKLTKFIRKDPPPNDTRSQGTSNLLHRAVMKNNHVVVSELLKCGYRNVDAKNHDGQTAVHLAALHGDEKMLHLLINAGVNVNCMDTANYMPLHYACRCQSGSFIRTLLLAQANVQGRNIKNGYVPLHEAAKYGNLEAIKELLNFHAPLLPRTSFGEFPLDLAKSAGHQEVVAFLENYVLPPARTFKSKWYHGTLTREEAIETLMEYSKNLRKQKLQDIDLNKNPSPATEIDSSGCFLIRFSDRKSAGSGYVLTMFFDSTVKNFIISQSSKFLFIDDGPYLPSLEHLVEHFMHFADGLPVNLRYPVTPKPKPPLPLFSTMPRTSRKKSLDILIGINQTTCQFDSMKSTSSFPEESNQLLQSTHINHKKRSKEISNSVFSTLRLRSPKKSVESKSTLRKRNKSRPSVVHSPDDKIKMTNAEEIQKAEDFIKNLSFSTDFNESHVTAASMNEFYNVPKNNAVVEAAIKKAMNFKEDLSSNDPPTEMYIEEKTEDEVDYFTKSDVVIERERNKSLQPCMDEYVSASTDVLMNSCKETNTFENEAMLPLSDVDTDFSKHTENLDTFLSKASNLNEITNCQTISKCETACNYFIPRDNLLLDIIIGEGEFGSVFKGFLIQREGNTRKHREIAIKTLRDEHCRSNRTEFLREASVMIHLKHHCIVQLIGISKEETLMMVQELVPLGSMLRFILEQKDTIRPNYELKLWASQIACGMQYLESNHFVHRDLAARNILLASRNQAKISDFGLSRALGNDGECYQATQGGKWPIKWYAPESYNNGLFSHASDVWSFGVTLWEMFSLGEAPYGDIRGVDTIQLIESGHRLPQPTLCPIHIYKIIQNCWNYKAKDRPTFRYLTDFFSSDPDYQNIVELIKTTHIN
uniref:Tyrosine-protein kinase n=1 Tax=Glossina brevipalpis TaxID=37001 RepID=A0A1A9WHW4_9MUSC